MIYEIQGQRIAKNGTSKLTPQQVLEVKELLCKNCISQRAIARRYKVSQATISRIYNSINWPELA
jgi:DNA-binding MarR family transcriptional regulator